MENKTCTKCNAPKPTSEFYFRKGKVCNICKECEKKVSIIYKNKNKLIIKENRKKQYILNKESEKAYNKKYKEQKKDEIREQRKGYAKLNKEKIREKDRNYRRNRMKRDPLYKLIKSVRNLVSKSFKKNNIKKNSKTIVILCCSFENFKLYIESKWEPWMNWDNYGIYKPEGERTWQIDHIIPISLATTEDEAIKLSHYTNLRPLCSKENLDKSNKL